MELIDKKNAINHIMRELDDSEEYNEGLRTAATIVDQEDCYKIVHCQDCKHWMPYDWMFSEVWKSKNIEDYQEEEIGCVYCDMNMSANDFCSRGEKKMSEHITKQEALQAIDDIYDNWEEINVYLPYWEEAEDKIRYDKVRNFINNMPQYIIRCQDCKYGEFPAHNVRCSQFYGAGCYNGFCAWGEKK